MFEVIFLKEEKMHLTNKLFNNETIRTVWDQEKEKYYVSIVDIVGVLAESKEPRKYWNWYKNKIKKDEDFEVSSITRQLKLKANDGKYRKTDVADIEGMFRIIDRAKGYDEEWITRRIKALVVKQPKILEKISKKNQVKLLLVKIIH